MRITNQDGGDRLPTWVQELVDSSLKCQLVPDEVNDSNDSVDLSKEEPTKGLKIVATVDVQLASDEDINR